MAVRSHIDDSVLCSVAIKTTGDEPYHNSLLEIVIIPFDRAFRLNKNAPMFICTNLKPLKKYDPSWMKISQSEYLEYQIQGVDPYYYADLLEQWKSKFQLPETHSIITVTYQPFTFYSFMIDWLGYQTTKYIFGDKIRGIDQLGQIYKDMCWFRNENFVYNQTTYLSLANECGVEASLTDSTWQRAVNYMSIYTKMLEKGILYERYGIAKR